MPFSLSINAPKLISYSFPKSNSRLACQLLDWAKRISILYFFPAVTSKEKLLGIVRQLVYFATDLPSTNNSKAPVAPVLKTNFSEVFAVNSVSYFPEKPSSFTPEANSC